MNFRAIFRYLRLSTVACLLVTALLASEHHGVVRFGSIPIPGATVTATKDDKKVVAITDENGMYQFPELEDGTWKIQVEMLTFETVTRDIGVASAAPGAEWELKLQSLDQIKPAQAAPVTAPTAGTAPPAGTTTPTAPAAAGAAATPAPAANTSTAAANSKNTKAKKGTPAASTNPNVGFQRTDVNASGGDAAASGAASAGPPPSIAESAGATEALVVNGSSSNGIERRAIGNGRKGPRSLFNGGIDFRNFENDYLDARSYSVTGQNTPRSPYTDFLAGGSVQGPLWVPHLFHWQGNFGVSYQTSRNRNANNTQYTMPTALERAGNFSQVTNGDGSPIVILDPSTGQPIPNGIIPSNEISPIATKLLGFYPLPQFTAPGVNWNYQIPIVTHGVSDQLAVRANKPINQKNSLNFQFVFVDGQNSSNSPFISPLPPVGSFVDSTHTDNYRGHVTFNHNFSRSVFGQFAVDYTRSNVLATPYFAGATNVSGAFGINGNSQAPLDWGPPGLGFGTSSIAGLTDGNERYARNQTAAFSASATWYRRPHTFQFGADYKRQNFDTIGQQNPRGSFGFTGQATGNPNCVSSLTTTCPGFDFADFMFGVPDTSRIAFGNADKYLSDNIYDLFVNDDWKVSSSFTFQWGVRWDYNSPISEEYGRLVNLDIAPGFTSATPVLGYSPVGALSGMHYPASLINPDRHQISPRISFAWRPIFGSSMVVRGGFGIYYNTSVYSAIATNMEQQSPLSKSLNVTNTPQDPLTLANGFVASPNVLTDTFAVDPNYKVSYTYNWYVSVQQNVTASLLLTGQYSGIKGTRLAQEFDPNTYAIGATNPCPSCLPGYTYLTSNGNSNYEAGSLTARRRFHAGISTIFTYTYSKAIDDAGGLGSATGGVAQNWLDLAAERALSGNDQRHLFTAALQYSTGVGVHGGALLSGWRGLILKGWTFQSNIRAGSGLPFTPSYPYASVAGVSVPFRPEYVGGDVYGGGRYLNPAAFAAPPNGQFGDAGRDSLIGPKQFSWNGSMARSFVEKYTLTVSATNVLNHPIVSGYYSSWSPGLANGGQFGLPLNYNGMRNLQATFRWTF